MDRKVSVTVNQTSRPHGEELDVPGLGLFRNGVPKLITDEDMITFSAVQPQGPTVVTTELASTSEKEGKEEEGEPVFQTSRGQVLAQAFAGSPHISVVEEDVEPLKLPDDEKEEKSGKAKQTVKSSAPVGDKGTDARKSDKEE